MGTTLGTAPTQESQRKGNSKKRSHSMSVETFDARGLLLGNRYYMMAQIGKGTFAEVYSARDLFTDKTVAIKFQSHDIRGNLSGLFNREASILNRFKSCPRVPALYKHCDLKWTQGDEGTTPSIIQREALIMEMCQGEDMAHLRNATRKRYKKLVSAVQGSPEIPLPVAAYMVCEMVACLKPLHEIGVVHRDVKPSNFVRATSTGTSFKVLDFGLARMWRDDGGKVVSPREDVGFRGTSNYASVVALRGQEQGPRDDLWSVLYVFIDMVANELPWSGVSRARSSKDLSGGLVGLKESHSGNPADKEDKLLEWIQSKVPRVTRSQLRPLEDMAGYLSSLSYADLPDHDRIIGFFAPLLHNADVSDPTYASEGFSWGRGVDNLQAAAESAYQPSPLCRAKCLLNALGMVPSDASWQLGVCQPSLPSHLTMLEQGRLWAQEAGSHLRRLPMLRDKDVQTLLTVRLVLSSRFQTCEPSDNEEDWAVFQHVLETVAMFCEAYGDDVKECEKMGTDAFLKARHAMEVILPKVSIAERSIPRRVSNGGAAARIHHTHSGSSSGGGGGSGHDRAVRDSPLQQVASGSRNSPAPPLTPCLTAELALLGADVSCASAASSGVSSSGDVGPGTPHGLDVFSSVRSRCKLTVTTTSTGSS